MRDLLILGVTAFILMLTGTTIDNKQTPVTTPTYTKDIDSIAKDTRLKTFQIKTLLFQTNVKKDTTIVTIKKAATIKSRL